MSSLVTAAIVLRTIDYGESDRVVTLLGRQTGCLGAIARGARRSQRRFGGGLGLCSIGEAALRERGASELLTLERFEVVRSFFSFGSDLARMGHAAYIAELLSKLCAPRQAEPQIFELAVSFLEGVDVQGASTKRLRVFELALLRELGFGPALDECGVCGRRDLSTGEEIDVRFVPDSGGVICRGCISRGRLMRPAVRLALSALARIPLAEADAVVMTSDVARGCREALAELIASHLSAPLRSLSFLNQVESDLRGQGIDGSGEVESGRIAALSEENA